MRSVALAYEDIEAVCEAGWLEGYADHTFRPDKPMSREEAATLFARVIHGGGLAGAVPVPPFRDVAADRWSAGAITLVKVDGLITGAAPDAYEPARAVTRAEIAVIIDRYLQSRARLAYAAP